MKKLFTLFAALVTVVALNAQTVDYALIGFINEEQNFLEEIVLDMNDDLNPLVALLNNGPDVPAATDTIYVHISIMGQRIGSLALLGAQAANLTAGQATALNAQEPIFSADLMNQYGIEGTFEFCYEVEIAGAATDPDASNNTACINITRGATAINEMSANEVSVYPNPATTVINVANAEGAQVTVYDINGRQITSVESASANQTIDASSFAKGMYIVRIANGNNVTTQKVSVVR